MKKKLIAIVAALALSCSVVCAFAGSAFAEDVPDDSGVYIGGVNENDALEPGEKYSVGGGTVSLSPDGKTLTLSDATISKTTGFFEDEDEGGDAITIYGIPELIVVLEGTNTIRGENIGHPIDAIPKYYDEGSASVAFYGPGKLIFDEQIYVETNIVIEDGTFEFNGSGDDDAFRVYFGCIVVNNGCFNINCGCHAFFSAQADITINGGTFHIASGLSGLSAINGTVKVNGGYLCIIANTRNDPEEFAIDAQDLVINPNLVVMAGANAESALMVAADSYDGRTPYVEIGGEPLPDPIPTTGDSIPFAALLVISMVAATAVGLTFARHLV